MLTLTGYLAQTEKGSRANHATLPNATSWSTHHLFWSKVKSTKPLPTILSRRGKAQTFGCLGSEVCKHIMDPTEMLSIPATISPSPFLLVSCRWRIFLCFLKPHGPMYVLSPSLTSRFSSSRLDNEMGFSFQKLLWFCCYTKNCDLHCMVLDLFTFLMASGKGYTGESILQNHLPLLPMMHF